jgi:transposase-like protein
MSKQTRRKFSAEFKAKVALEASKNQYTLSELGVKFEVSPVLISKWKAEFLENMASVFDKGTKKRDESDPAIELPYSQIGKLKIANEF